MVGPEARRRPRESPFATTSNSENSLTGSGEREHPRHCSRADASSSFAWRKRLLKSTNPRVVQTFSVVELATDPVEVVVLAELPLAGVQQHRRAETGMLPVEVKLDVAI